jgi:hypothetical protein
MFCHSSHTPRLYKMCRERASERVRAASSVVVDEELQLNCCGSLTKAAELACRPSAVMKWSGIFVYQIDSGWQAVKIAASGGLTVAESSLGGAYSIV